jgi:hypothetical protein
MDGMQPDESGSSLVSITVLSVMPARAGKLFALSPNSGNRAMRCSPLPKSHKRLIWKAALAAARSKGIIT